MADRMSSGDSAARHAARVISAATQREHEIAVVLGSGWNHLAETMSDGIVLPFEHVPGLNPPGVPGHAGRLISVQVRGRGVLAFAGRTHLYEGLGVDVAVEHVRIAAASGCTTLIVTNGAGSLNPQWPPGTAVVIGDHINLTGRSPLRGPQFVDMTDAYSPALRELAHAVDPSVPEGVYAQFPGPQFETPAEVRMAGVLGADLVGMSTALETIAARSLGMQVLGLSLVTNPAAGLSDQGVDHQAILEVGSHAQDRLAGLLTAILEAL